MELLEPLDIRLIAPAHGPIPPPSARLRLATAKWPPRACSHRAAAKTLAVFYHLRLRQHPQHGRSRAWRRAEVIGGVRVSLFDLEGGESAHFTDLIGSCRRSGLWQPDASTATRPPIWDVLSSLTTVNVKGQVWRRVRLLRLERRGGAAD